MINLLLPEDQIKLRADYRRRLSATAAGLMLAWLVVVLVIAGALYLFIRHRQIESAAALAAAKQALAGENLEQLAAAIKETNEQVDRLILPAPAPPSEIIARIIEPRGRVRLEKISYAGGQKTIDLAGTAPARPDFLSYLEALRALPEIVRVDSPVRNLIQEKNLSFTLNLTLK